MYEIAIAPLDGMKSCMKSQVDRLDTYKGDIFWKQGIYGAKKALRQGALAIKVKGEVACMDTCIGSATSVGAHFFVQDRAQCFLYFRLHSDDIGLALPAVKVRSLEIYPP